jgi:Ca-activated chloride channel family protein
MKTRLGRSAAIYLGAVLLWLSPLGGCDDGKSASNAPGQPAATAKKADRPGVLTLTFAYSSEKEQWVQVRTAAFNEKSAKTPGGKVIEVDAIPMGSGDTIDEIVTGRRHSHLVSPASAAFIEMGNAQYKAKTGKDLLQKPTNLLMSPVVIAMWKPMAEALGYGTKPVGWHEVIEVSRSPKGWGAYGHAEWGSFKFGHTHPGYSNSGLISVLAEAYAGANKTANLKLSDVTDPEDDGVRRRD